MSKTDERRWLWWVLGVLLAGLAASFFFFQRPSGPATIDNSGAARLRPAFPKGGALPDLPRRGNLQPAHRLPPDPQLDRSQSK